MTTSRRRFLCHIGAAAALSAVPRIASAQNYPTRPVRIIVGYPPGGSDIVARLIAQLLSERLGQPFIVENRPGANSNIATEMVTHAVPDGHTLLYFSTSAAINATLYEKLNFNLIRDIAPVGSTLRNISVMAVNPSLPTVSVGEFIAYAKANPGKVTVASSGIGSTGHVTAELFKMMTGINLVHVPYRGDAPAVTDLLGGQVQMMFAAVPGASNEYLLTGKLRALAVTTATRWMALPNVPTLGEFVPGFEASGWFGFGAPKNTPVQIIDRLNGEINAVLTDPKIIARLTALGATPYTGRAADFRMLIADETEKWAKVIRTANIKPE
jgi:tripartite-type tricarboxylate transporter receptor subunit TctC